MTGAEVKEWREARDISQRQLAKLLPMNLTTLQGWERAEPRGMPPPFMRRALANLEGELLAKAESPREGIAALGGARPATPVAQSLAHALLSYPEGRGAQIVVRERQQGEPNPWTDEGAGEGFPPQSTAHELSYESDDQQPVEQEGEFDARTHAKRRK